MSSREIYVVENLNLDDQRQTMTFALLLILSWEMSTTLLENVKQLKTHLIFDIFRAFESVFYFDLMTFSLFQVCLNHHPVEKQSDPHCTWVQGKPQLLIDVKTFVHFGKLVEDAPMENAFWKLFQTNQRWLWWIMMIMADNFFSAFIWHWKRRCWMLRPSSKIQMMQMFMMEKYIQLKYFALKAKRKVVTKSKKLIPLFFKRNI